MYLRYEHFNTKSEDVFPPKLDGLFAFTAVMFGMLAKRFYITPIWNYFTEFRN